MGKVSRLQVLDPLFKKRDSGLSDRAIIGQVVKINLQTSWLPTGPNLLPGKSRRPRIEKEQVARFASDHFQGGLQVEMLGSSPKFDIFARSANRASNNLE
jgi:hypothetical protein